ncbi:unannotated protein [freshwater metagenome]|uniref:Unannotated protein n=1 Tax=freshwater metagenome TaxID=449393 RepID=A0A6J7IWD9_9ZZZZ
MTTTEPVIDSVPASFSAIAASLATTLFCEVPVPSAVTTTGVEPGRPPSTRPAAMPGSDSACTCSTSGLPVPVLAAARAPRSTGSSPRRSAWTDPAPMATPA